MTRRKLFRIKLNSCTLLLGKRTLVMGVLNVTPDSFSDGGKFLQPENAIEQAYAVERAGADLLDIGGESTRPGSAETAASEESHRILPVLEALRGRLKIPISVDTRRASVAELALRAGAELLNDVSGLKSDPRIAEVAARHGVPLILMHMRGEPRTMQQAPEYADVVAEVRDFLVARAAACVAAGIARERIVVDPGIGFGKDRGHNLELLERIAMLHGLGCGILLGVSRKSMIGRVTNSVAAKDRLPGSLAAELHGIGQGVQIVRVHDVAETRQAIAVWQAITEAA